MDVLAWVRSGLAGGGGTGQAVVIVPLSPWGVFDLSAGLIFQSACAIIFSEVKIMPRGRKTKLDETLIERICDLVKLRVSWNRIAYIIGIDPRTLRKWRERGEKQKRGLCRELVDGVNRAEAEGYVDAVQVFRKAMLGGEKIRQTKVVLDKGIPVKTEITEKELAPNWKAALEWLARTEPEMWGNYERLRLETDLRVEVESLGLELEDVLQAAMQLIENLVDPAKLISETEADVVIPAIALPGDVPSSEED